MISKEEILKKLKEFKQEKQTVYGFSKIGIFGSIARGENHENSDIDIIIEQNIPDLLLLGSIKSDLEDEFGVKIDLLRFHDGMNDFLKNRIKQDCIYV